jgi:hypothetical protein
VKNTFDVEIENPDDGSLRAYRVTADDRESRAFESEFQMLITDSKPDQAWLAQMAWLASRRRGLFDGTLDDFLAQAAQVELVQDAETGEVQPADPTRSAATET